MTTLREAAQQALEALEEINKLSIGENAICLPAEIEVAMNALRERLAQPEQEPFCFHDGRNIVGKEYADHSDVFPLYTAPQPPQWQGLTDEEKAELDAEHGDDTLAHLDAIEAKLKEKNQ